MKRARIRSRIRRRILTYRIGQTTYRPCAYAHCANSKKINEVVRYVRCANCTKCIEDVRLCHWHSQVAQST